MEVLKRKNKYKCHGFSSFSQRTNTMFGLLWTNCPRVLCSVTWIKSLNHSAPQALLTTGRQEGMSSCPGCWDHWGISSKGEESLLDPLHPPLAGTRILQFPRLFLPLCLGSCCPFCHNALSPLYHLANSYSSCKTQLLSRTYCIMLGFSHLCVCCPHWIISSLKARVKFCWYNS